MKKIKIYTFVFICQLGLTLLANAQRPLWVVSQLEDPELANQAISFLQCLSSAGLNQWEIRDTAAPQGEPYLDIKEADTHIDIIAYAPGKTPLRAKSAADCTPIAEYFTHLSLRQLAPPLHLEAQQNLGVSALEEESFWQRNKFWILGSTAVAGVLLFWQPWKQERVTNTGSYQVEVR